MTTCPDENRLVEYVEGLLAADLQRVIDEHVDDCVECRQLLAWFAQGSADASASGPELAAGSPFADRYTIVDLVGTGAMSIVYAAYDRVLDRKIALKVLRDPDETQATRLGREAQAMARLAHPNVLPVHDVGTTGGRMFLTAELVTGQTLAQWLAHEPSASWRDVIELFVQAGRGLAAAHAAGIAHRDFKPSNVLIGEDGRVRVADFGLARSAPVEGSPAERALATALDSGRGDALSTRTGELVGTPAYMAPEQLAGEPGEPGSDQFAFCVSLFEALHGERPFHAASLSGLQRAIARGPARGNRRIPMRVQRVLERGLAVAPARRMASMDDVVHELERALARPRIAWAAAAVGLVVAAGVGVLALGHHADPCAAARHGLEGTWDDGARDAVRAAFRASGASDATYARVAAHLDGYASRWTAMRVEVCQATEVRHTQSPALLDLRIQCLDRRRAELAALVGTWQRAPEREQIARAAGAALQLSPIDACADVAALTARIPPPEDPLKRQLVTALGEHLATATGLQRAGKYRDALAIAREVATRAEASGYVPLLADALHRRATLEGAVGDNKAAEATMTEAIRDAALAHDDRLLATAWTGLVEIVGYRLARHDEGLALGRTAEIAVLRAGNDPLLAADLHQQRGMILRDEARFDAALAEQREALELRRRAFPDGDPSIAQSIHDLAEIERMLGKLDQARADHQQALDLRERLLGPDHPLVAVSLTNLGHCYFALDQTDEARTRYTQALAIDLRSLPADHIEVGNALTSLAAVDLRVAKWSDGIAKLERARTIYTKALGAQHPMVAIVETNLGEAERGLEHFDAAITHFENALAIRLARGSREQPGVATALSNLADVLVIQHRYADAKPKYEESLATFRKVLGADTHMAANQLVGLARIALAEHDKLTARKLLEEARPLRVDATPDEQAEVRELLDRAR